MTHTEDIDRRIGEAVRAARRERQLSTRQLAGLAGIAQSTLSNIENGRIRAGVATLYLLAEALSVPPARFLSEGDRSRGHDDATASTGARLRALPAGPHARMEVYEVVVPADEAEPEAFQHSGDDAICVVEGRGALELGARTIDLRAGDVLLIDATARHRFRAASDATLVVQVVTVRSNDAHVES